MPRKRKAGGGNGTARHLQQQQQSDDDLDGGRFKMNVQDYMDVADSEDEWEHQRDKILLEDDGPARKRQRRREEEALTLDDSAEEVLSVPSDLESDEEGYDDEEEIEDDSFGAQVSGTGIQKRPRASGDVDEDEDEDGQDEARRRRPEDEEGWGNDDAYGADVAEDEDEAKEIEAEALRLQKKRLESLTDADFGFDEAEWLGANGEEEGGDTTGTNGNGTVTELLPLTSISEDTPAEEKWRILRLRYPEFEPLADEFQTMQQLIDEIRPAAEESLRRFQKRRRSRENMGQEPDGLILPAAVLKYNSLTAYAATLAMYFALLASPGSDAKDGTQALPMDPAELREHSIMDSLVRQRTLWEKVRDLSDSEYESDGHDTDSSDPADPSEMSVYYTPKEDTFGDKLPEAIREDLVPHKPARRLSKKMQAAVDARAAEQAKRDAYLKKLDEDIANFDKIATPSDLREFTGSSISASRSTKANGAFRRMDADIPAYDSDFGDEAPLTVDEALAKEKRRKSLRFYTSQIAQKANKRSRMGQDQGGDTDIPYRERDKDRIARLNAEAEARGRKNKNCARSDELGGDSDDEDRAIATASRSANAAAAAAGIHDDDDGGEDYYQTIASRKTAKKANKDARKAALREAALRGAQLHEVEQVGPDGKRAIGYTIEKNKGLTQNRRKDVRNPRVKKRKKFEDKKKKLASMRQVYKGGEGRGGYGGELTGIKKGIVRSVKL